MSLSQNRTFRLKLPIVLPHIARFWPLNVAMAQITNDSDMASVLPDRIAPSAMMPSLSLTGLVGIHQVSSCFCLMLNGANVKNPRRPLNARLADSFDRARSAWIRSSIFVRSISPHL